jgi:SAM-dependent methyltransferase
MARQHYRGASARNYDRRWATFTARMQAPILDLVTPDLRPGMRVLDAGCGTGTLLAALAARQPDLTLSGADASPDMLAQARAKLGERAHLFVLDLDKPLPEAVREDLRVDLVLCVSVLHYLRTPAATVRSLAGLLAPGGHMILADFTRHGWWWPGFEVVLCATAAHAGARRPGRAGARGGNAPNGAAHRARGRSVARHHRPRRVKVSGVRRRSAALARPAAEQEGFIGPDSTLRAAHRGHRW